MSQKTISRVFIHLFFLDIFRSLKEVETVKETTENWMTAAMEVRSLAELNARSGIETVLF